MEYKFDDLTADDIEVRIATVKSNGLSLLLYKDARCDMRILDKCVSPENWQRDHKELKGNIYCGISIYDSKKEIWVTKWDCGSESYTDKEKGEASDSFKRAAFNWGIGRELYTSPFIWIPSNLCNIEGNKCYDRFEVKSIEIKDKKIVNLEISLKNKVVFSTKQKITNTIESPQPKAGKPVETPKTTNVLENVLKSGKHQGKKWIEICQDDMSYVDYLITQTNNPTAKKVKEEYYKRFPDAPKYIEVSEEDCNMLNNPSSAFYQGGDR